MPQTSFFFITNLAQDEQQIIRYVALLRGTESAWQALSYGLGSLAVFATVGSTYLNFGRPVGRRHLPGVGGHPPLWRRSATVGAKGGLAVADARRRGC